MAKPSGQEKSMLTVEVRSNTTRISQALLHPVASIIVGVVLGIIFGFAGKGWLNGIASGILSSLGVLYLQGFVQAKESIKGFSKIKRDSLDSVKYITAESVRGFHCIQLALGFEKLYDLARALPRKHFLFYKNITDEIASRGGAIVVKAEEQCYLEHLEALLPISNKSFLATLRGGRDTPEFTLGWFFEDSAGLSAEQRMNWLTSVRDADIPIKTRLLLFS